MITAGSERGIYRFCLFVCLFVLKTVHAVGFQVAHNNL